MPNAELSGAVPSAEDSVQTDQGQKAKFRNTGFQDLPLGHFPRRDERNPTSLPVPHGFEASWKGGAVWAPFSHGGLVHLETRTPPTVLVLSRCGLRAPGGALSVPRRQCEAGLEEASLSSFQAPQGSSTGPKRCTLFL